ncbi:MAG: terminase family protein, partial [Clostridia bacterium]|nr:terminase family protein [Clostridia bacterium]
MQRKKEAVFAVTEKQLAFLRADATEVLFGGAAGGGKSYGQLVDAMRYALRYPGSKQLVLRRTYAELEKSLIRVYLGLFPREIYSYNATGHVGRFKNGSLLDFGYCAGENDVFQYQSAEYDVIRFDELTHFTEFQYLYLMSRLRGANGFPKQIKSATNPGGVGHAWVKGRFIDPAPPQTVFGDGKTTRIFLPSKIDDNPYLTAGDPAYKTRLLSLPENQRKALLYGDWNIFEGQYFPEFSEADHVIDPFPIPADWRRYRTIDYGLDRLACLWVAISPEGDFYVYKELCESDKIISDAAKDVRERNGDDKIYATLAPPDLWSRSQETGKSKAILFAENGLTLTRSSNDRETGWLAIKELLKPR